MAPNTSIDRAIAARARKQRSLIHINHLRDLGATREDRRRLLRRGWLTEVQPRVFRVGAPFPDWRTDLLAATLSAGSGAAVAYASAARLWQCTDLVLERPEIVIPEARQAHLRGVRVVRSRDLSPGDITSTDGIPVTSCARTLTDLGSVFPLWALRDAVDKVLRRGRVNRDALVRYAKAHQRRGRSGPTSLLEVLGEFPEAQTDSWLEDEFVRLLIAAGLPLPEAQVVIVPGPGGIRVDFVYRDLMLVIELDGHHSHSTRRQRQHDAERSARLLVLGYHVLRFTYDDVVNRPQYVVAQVRAALEALSARIPAEL